MLNLPIVAGGGVAAVTASTGLLNTGTAASPILLVDQSTAFNWTGTQTWDQEDNGTTSVPTPVTLQHRNNAAGTPAAGYGVGLVFALDSSTRALRSAVEIDGVWSTATNGSEVSALAVKTMLAGALTEVFRIGTGATLPDSDVSFSMGRALIDSRGSDVVFISHRDMTTTLNYALRTSSVGATILNCASGQSTSIAHNGTIRIQVNTTGIGMFGATPVAINTGWTTFANLASDKTLDVNATTTTELGNVLGTLIETLKTAGCFIST